VGNARAHCKEKSKESFTIVTEQWVGKLHFTSLTLEGVPCSCKVERGEQIQVKLQLKGDFVVFGVRGDATDWRSRWDVLGS